MAETPWILCTHCGIPRPDDTLPCARCENYLVGSPRETLIDRRYRVERELARGGMGVVLLAKEVSLQRSVALKKFAPGIAPSRTTLARFHREARALASLRNDHVVGVYGFGMHEGELYLAMEYVAGVNLADVIAQHSVHGTRLALHRVSTIVSAIARGLAAVHAAGVVHCDVKPENIVIERGTGRPVLVDFGLVRSERWDGDTGAGEQAGTPNYMAPECFDPEKFGAVTTATDLYALGCTAYELLCNELPFEAENPWKIAFKQVGEQALPLSARVPELQALDGVIAKALAKKPADRPAEVLVFAEELAAAIQKVGIPGESTAPQAKVGARVLVVDDDPVFARFASRAVELAFQRTPVGLSVARSGTEALAIAEKGCPHLVLLDYNMPGIDGVETLSRMRELPGGSGMHVMVVSAGLVEDAQWRFAALGVQEFLTKPIGLSSFMNCVANAARKHGWLSPESMLSDNVVVRQR